MKNQIINKIILNTSIIFGIVNINPNKNPNIIEHININNNVLNISFIAPYSSLLLDVP